MNLPLTNFEIIFNEDFFKENSLTEDEVWFDIKFIVNEFYSFEITNLSSEELYDLLIKFEDILEDKDAIIYLDDCTDIYLEFTKEYLKFYSEFDKSNGFVKISTTFNNNEIVKDAIINFTGKIKNIILNLRENEISNTSEDINEISNEIINSLKDILKDESIKNEMQIVKDFINKNPDIKNKDSNLHSEILSEFQIIFSNYNKKILIIPEFVNIIKKITSIYDSEIKEKILTIVTDQLRNVLNE